MCHGTLKQWEQCEADAGVATHLDDKYTKGYYWLVKAAVSGIAFSYHGAMVKWYILTIFIVLCFYAYTVL